MEKKNITPEQNQPIHRISNGQLPAELAELSEEILQDESFAPSLAGSSVSTGCGCILGYCAMCIDGYCSYDGDDPE